MWAARFAFLATHFQRTSLKPRHKLQISSNRSRTLQAWLHAFPFTHSTRTLESVSMTIWEYPHWEASWRPLTAASPSAWSAELHQYRHANPAQKRPSELLITIPHPALVYSGFQEPSVFTLTYPCWGGSHRGSSFWVEGPRRLIEEGGISIQVLLCSTNNFVQHMERFRVTSFKYSTGCLFGCLALQGTMKIWTSDYWKIFFIWLDLVEIIWIAFDTNNLYKFGLGLKFKRAISF